MGTRTPNQLIKSQLLYQLSYRGSAGTFYGRATVDGKIYRQSLKTMVFSVAKQKLPDLKLPEPHPFEKMLEMIDTSMSVVGNLPASRTYLDEARKLDPSCFLLERAQDSLDGAER